MYHKLLATLKTAPNSDDEEEEEDESEEESDKDNTEADSDKFQDESEMKDEDNDTSVPDEALGNEFLFFLFTHCVAQKRVDLLPSLCPCCRKRG